MLYLFQIILLVNKSYGKCMHFYIVQMYLDLKTADFYFIREKKKT